jgi:hypothetical protein
MHPGLSGENGLTTYSEQKNGTDALGSLLEASHLIGPDDLAAAVVRHGEHLGARDVVILLADYEQESLIPLPVRGREASEAQAIDGTLAGRAFQTVEIVQSTEETARHLWVPILDGTERLGVLKAALAQPSSQPSKLQEWSNFAALVAELLVTKGLYGDAFTCVRRTREMTLAAEIQWELLPPLTFTTREMAISGMLEPSYDIGGDTFDYAVNDAVLHLAIIDAMGRGLPASLLAGAIVASYRHSRRQGHDLAETFLAIDGIVAEQFGPDRFATLQLVQFEYQTGRLEWLNAGHPLPLLLRAGKTVKTLECEPSLPAGLNGTVAEIAQQWLEPEDHVLFFTDGMIEARSPSGEMFGESHLGEVLAREVQAGLPPAETTRRITRSVLAHLDHRLRDDVSDVLIQWKGR